MAISLPTPDDDGSDDLNALRAQLKEAQDRAQSLEQQLAGRPTEPRPMPSAPEESSLDMAPINEADVTLRRLVQRIAMILQAEKIVIMFFDPESSELIGIPPAYGVPEDRLAIFRVRARDGISGQVYREGEPAIYHDATADPRTQKDPFALLHVLNGITVPLVIEKRDEENRVIERSTIGVLHAFNKRFGDDFNDEDVRLLERMARNVGSIIANLQLYRKIVEEREELLQTFESLAAGLVLVSPEGKLIQINATARTLFNVSTEAHGKHYSEHIRAAGLEDLIESTLRGEEPPRLEIDVFVQNVDRIYQAQSAQVRGEDGKVLGVVAIFTDVTEIKNMERMKGSFVAMASHELRTPLTAIKGFVSTLLMDDTFEPEERREFYMIIDQECDRLTRLINDLLNTARIEQGESLKPDYKMIQVQPLLEKILKIQEASPACTARHRLRLEVEGVIPPVAADEDKFDQIVTNLMGNALKYSPNGGDVTVIASVEGDQLRIGVRDQGLGIPKEHLTRVFDKFHRVNNEDNRKIYGTGLGLYLVKHLVEQVHLGKIWAESEVGHGSTFWFTMPLKLDVEKAKELNN